MNKSTFINTSTLPSDVFELKHDDFYGFVDFQCGPTQANILKFQLISDADTFIECDDPTKIMQYDSDRLNELKAKACLITKDGTIIVLPGIIASLSTLKKRLLKKYDEDMKQLKKNLNISNASTPLPATTTSQRSIQELKNHIIKSIDQWIDKYRNGLNLEANSSLTESVDYNIECVDNIIGQQSVAIVCSCRSKLTLSRHVSNGYYQVSGSSSICTHRYALYSIYVDQDRNSFHFNY